MDHFGKCDGNYVEILPKIHPLFQDLYHVTARFLLGAHLLDVYYFF